MMNESINKIQGYLLLLTSILLASCGGGGGDNTAAASQEQTVIILPRYFVPSFSKISFPWGAISIANFNNDQIDELLGTQRIANGFVSLTESDLGLTNLRAGRAYRDIRFADFNNDGFLDAIANVYTEDPAEGYIQLYWGVEGGKFEIDVDFAANNFQGYGETIVVADFNNDNYIDIFIPQYKTSTREISRNLLFKNLKNKQFEEVAVAAGVAVGLQTNPEGAQAADYNQDGLIDLYASGSLFKNNGNLNFSDVTVAVGLPGVFDEGAKFFDQNNDGILDLIIHNPVYGPRIFLGGLDGKFTELTGIFPSEFFAASYGINVGDVNGDSFDDILIAGGLAQGGSNAAPKLWLYKDGKYQSEFLIEPDLGWSDLVSFGDLDSNGSLDVVLRYGANLILLNDQVPLKYIKLDIRGGGLRNQQGRVIKAHLPEGKTKAMVVDGGSGYMSNQPYAILIPNNFDVPINFDIYCGSKVISFDALDGYHAIDCGSI
jgi:hypothetical protein